MRRRLAALLAAALAASTLAVLTSVQPAAADVCVGAGTASIGGNGLFYPLLGTQTSTSGADGGSLTLYTLPRLEAFSFSLNATGLCALGDLTVWATGMVSGWCGHSFGSGATALGTRFAWVGAGSFLFLTGGLVGLVNATPNVPAGQSCATGALGFLVAGAVVVTDCSVLKNKTDTLPISIPDPLFHTLTTVGATSAHLTIQGGNYHVWTKLCAGV